MPVKVFSKKVFKELASKSAPKWEVLKRQIRHQVLSGDFVPGDALPSETALCKQFGLARSTIRQALSELDKEGLIRRVQGKGTFVAHIKTKGKHTKTLDVFSLVLPQVDRDLYPKLINGFDEMALQVNHQVMVSTTHNDVYRQGDIMLQALDKKMAGVTLVPMYGKKTPPHHIRQLQMNGIPVVLCNRPVEGVSAPLVTWDWEEIGRIAARFFLKRGYSEIGYYAYIHHAMNEAHVRGMQEVLAEKGVTIEPNNIIYSPMDDGDEIKKELILRLLARPDHPRAILCNDDTEAENLYWLATDLGLKVPENLAILGFGISVREGMFRKRLTSVTINGFDIGKKAVDLLEEMRSGLRAITDNEVFRIDLGFATGATA